jgi:hypothetical protein
MRFNACWRRACHEGAASVAAAFFEPDQTLALKVSEVIGAVSRDLRFTGLPLRPSHDMNVRPRRAGPHNVCARGFMRGR